MERRQRSRRRAGVAIGIAVVIAMVVVVLQREDNSGAATPPSPTLTGVIAGVKKLTVGFAPHAGASAATTYRATCGSTDGGAGGTSKWRNGSPLKVSRLTPGRHYSCSVVARDSQGVSEQSNTSAVAAIPSPPGSPTPAGVFGRGRSLLVGFRSSSNSGGSPVTGYQAQCTSKQTGARKRSGWAQQSPAVVNGLGADEPYRCTVRARNIAGKSGESLAADGTTSPSGSSIPLAAPPGWRTVFADSFDTLDPSRWGRYEGVPGSDPGGFWSPSHTNAVNGYAELSNYVDGGRWTSGGMSSAHALKQAYGKYLVRFRIDKGYGVGYAILLWPSTGSWPTAGEIDFAEDGGGNRQSTTATLHYGANDSKIQRNLNADFSQWHTIGVEWTPNKLVYTLDGAAWATVNSTNVPRGPMELDIQSQTGTCGDPDRPCPNGTTPKRVNLQVDWVVAYAPA